MENVCFVDYVELTRVCTYVSTVLEYFTSIFPVSIRMTGVPQSEVSSSHRLHVSMELKWLTCMKTTYCNNNTYYAGQNQYVTGTDCKKITAIY